MNVTFEEFTKVDIRCGFITKADEVPKAKKVLRLEVDLGELGSRVIVAGIAKSYSPDDLVGRSVLVVANLEPRTIMGIESHGMLLAAPYGDTGCTLAWAHSMAPGVRLG